MRAGTRRRTGIPTFSPPTGQKVLYLELGVGRNTPVIIKYPFWRMTEQNKNATYACLSRSSAEAPMKIADRSICINGDIGETLKALQ